MVATTVQGKTPIVEISGEVEAEMRDLLRSVIGETEDPPRSLAQARRRVETATKQAYSVFRSQGYYAVEIEPHIDRTEASTAQNARSKITPVLFITPGPVFTFETVTIAYNDQAPDVKPEVAAQINIPTGSRANAAEVVAAELRTVNFLKANGYPEAEVLPRKAVVDHDTKTMRVAFNFRVGDKTRFGEIEQTGSAYLAKSWPKLVAPFTAGDVFSDRQMNTLTSRIIGTDVFESATAVLSDEKIENSDGTVTRNVILNVEQGDINTVTAELGYSTTDGSGVDLSYGRRNFIGYAQNLTLSSVIKTNQLLLGVDYTIPYMFRDDRSLDLAAEIAREDTEAFTGIRVGGEALLTQKISNRLRVAAGFGLEASRFEEDGEDVNAYLFDGLASATYDSRNSLLDPEKGIYVEASAVPTYNFGNNEGIFAAVNLGASTYRRLSSRFVAAGRAKLGTILSDAQDIIPLNRRFYGGGGGSVRGYEYQSISPLNTDGEAIGGRSISEMSAEIRYRGDSAIGGVAFLDAGSVAADGLPNLDNIRYGAGFGLRYYTSFAPLRADIAFPLNKQDGDDDFQIYLSIGQAF
jgi:translocation and assembly module TamA